MLFAQPFETIRLSLWALAAVLAVASVTTFLSWQEDRDVLHATAERIAVGRTTDRERAGALRHWVDRRGGTDAIRGYFLLPGLGATPVQVLRQGGNGADRARLLDQLLAADGLDAPACARCTAAVPLLYLSGDPEGLVATALLGAAVATGLLAIGVARVTRHRTAGRRPERHRAGGRSLAGRS